MNNPATPNNTGPRVGPATVVAVGEALRVRLEDDAENIDEVCAELALTFPYVPTVGDRVLVIGEAGEQFVIGVLSAAAPRSLDLGDTGGLHAGGLLTLASDDRLEVEAPHVGLRARALRRFAETLDETIGEATSWVRDVLTVRCGESRKVVTGADTTHAGRSRTLAKGKVKIDADTIDMGS